MQREPDMTGQFGKAWRSRHVKEPSERATLSTWLIERPGAHPAWSKWLVNICHLREMPGVERALKKYPEAEYELLVAAMNPEFETNVDTATWQILTPFDLIFQFHGVSDASAVRFVERYYVRSILDGASPDSDYRAWWEDVLASALKYSKGLS